MVKTAGFPERTIDDFTLTAVGTSQRDEIVVLDTSVLMSDPMAYASFDDANVVIPLTVIDELDHNKTRHDDAGRNARKALQALEGLRIGNQGNILSPVPLPTGGTIRIEPNGLHLGMVRKLHLDTNIPDHRIIAAALGLRTEGGRVRVVSNDASLRVKASVAGLEALEYTRAAPDPAAADRPGLERVVAGPELTKLAAGKAPFRIDMLPGGEQETVAGLLENEFAYLEGTSLTVRRNGGTLRPVGSVRRQGDMVGPRNKEQRCALELLTDESVSLVALRGHAGTGKTLLALAAGLNQISDGVYDQMMVLRPMLPVGRQDIGYLPGDIDEKTRPWFSAVADALVALSSGRKTFKQASDQLSGLVRTGQVMLEPVTFLRGRSLARTYILCDEAQNLEPATVKTVVSRLGAGSKLVLTGDSGQIDSPWVSAATCGLTAVVEAFAGVDLFGQMFFTRGERSRLADLAAERL